MKKIIDIQHVSNNDTDRFNTRVNVIVESMQKQNLEVDIQYQAAAISSSYGGSVHYTALITGYTNTIAVQGEYALQYNKVNSSEMEGLRKQSSWH